MAKQRLDKILASQNIGSRKEVVKLIKQGKVRVNLNIIKLQDYKVDPVVDEIFIDDKKLEFKKYIYIMMNKPQGVVSASNDKSQKTICCRSTLKEGVCFLREGLIKTPQVF